MRILNFSAFVLFGWGVAFGSPVLEKVETKVENSSKASLEIATGLATAMVGAQPGVHLALQVPLGQSGFFAGLETGAYFYTTPEFGLYLPILANFSARFDFSNKANLMLGLAPGIGIVSFDNSVKPGGRDHSGTYFNLMINPAFHLQVGEGQKVVVAPRVGTLNGNLLFSPVLGTAIDL